MKQILIKAVPWEEAGACEGCYYDKFDICKKQCEGEDVIFKSYEFDPAQLASETARADAAERELAKYKRLFEEAQPVAIGYDFPDKRDGPVIWFADIKPGEKLYRCPFPAQPVQAEVLVSVDKEQPGKVN